MTFINKSILTLSLVTLSLNAQNMSLFSKATNSGWYPEFLKPIVNEIAKSHNHQTILDVGTGPGTLPNLLIKRNHGFQIVAIDIDPIMINEAKKRTSNENITFQLQAKSEKLDFRDEQFDVVTFCSVLFLLEDSTKQNLVHEALRVLKKDGRLIILTPSGKKSIASSFIEVWSYQFSLNNFTFPIWKIATTNGGKKWQSDKWLHKFATDNQLSYTSELTFNNNATIETITKNNN